MLDDEFDAILSGTPGGSRRSRSGDPDFDAILHAGEGPPPEEPTFSRIARGIGNAAGAVGHAVGTPFRGLGMLATAAQESLANPESDIGAAPGSRLRVTPEGVGTSPDLGELALEGAIRAPAALAEGAYDARKPPSEAIGGNDLETRRGFERGPYRPLAQAEAVAEPIAKMGVQFLTDPALAPLGALGKAAGVGRAAEAFIGPQTEAGAAAAQKAVLLGKTAGATGRAIGASFVPGMVEGAYRGGQEYLRAGREEGYASPTALRSGAQAAIDAAMAVMVGGHTLHGEPPLETPGMSPEAARLGEIGQERAFLRPNPEAMGIAAEAGRQREQLASLRQAEAPPEPAEGFFSPDLEAEARGGIARTAREQMLAARAPTPDVYPGPAIEPVQPGIARTPQEVIADRMALEGTTTPEGMYPGPARPMPWADEAQPPVPLEEPLFQKGELQPPIQLPPLRGIAAAARRQRGAETPPPEGGAVVAPVQEPAGVPFMVTKKMRADLEDLGYTGGQIDRLKPEEAHAALAERRGPVPPPPVVEPGTAAPEPAPTPAQMEAENYRKGHLRWNGLEVSVETQKGGERVAKDGSWRVPDYPADYGYIKGSEGKDGDQVDVFMGDHPTASHVYVIDQVDPDTGKFDEHKSMVGFGSEKEALDTYHRAYTDGRTQERIGAVTTMSPAEFKEWVRKGDTKKPLSEVRERGRETGQVSAPPEEATPLAPTLPHPRAPERRVAQEPVTVEQRQAQRRTETAQRLNLPEEHPAVAEVLGAHEEARTDALTGIGNKKHWDELQKTVDREKDHVGVVDLKRFKPINDKYGHEAGDTVLKHVAAMARKHFGEDAARFGGDEFGIVLRNMSLEEARAKAEAFRTDLASHTVRIRNKATGEEFDIPGIEAHLGVGRNVSSADAAANAEAAPSRVGGRGSERPAGRAPEPAAGAIPERGLGDRTARPAEATVPEGQGTHEAVGGDLGRGRAAAPPSAERGRGGEAVGREGAGRAAGQASRVAPEAQRAATRPTAAEKAEAKLARARPKGVNEPGTKETTPVERERLPRYVSEITDYRREAPEKYYTPEGVLRALSAGELHHLWEDVAQEYPEKYPSLGESHLRTQDVPDEIAQETLGRILGIKKAGRTATQRDIQKALQSRRGPIYERLLDEWRTRQIDEHRTQLGERPLSAKEEEALPPGADRFEPPAEEAPKYATKPTAGQRGLPGIAEDVAAREREKPKGPEQQGMFGGEMLQGTERKGTEGREATGPLFNQAEQARLKREREGQGGIKFATKEKPEERDLTAFHNITGEELLKADKMGGLAMPSIAITRGKVHEGYGGITLVGDRRMIDPQESRENKVYPSDAYTGRFPETEFKPRRGAADKAFEGIPRKEFGETGDNLWDAFHKNPDEALREGRRSQAMKAAFLAENGVKVEPTRKPEDLRHEIGRESGLQDWAKGQERLSDMRPGDERWPEFSKQVEDAIASHKFEGRRAPIQAHLRDLLREQFFDKDTGELKFGPAHWLIDDILKVKEGRTRIDADANEKALDAGLAKLPHGSYEEWLRKKIAPLFDGEFLKLGRKKVPVTLDNVVEAMRRQGGAGAEKTMVFGAGNARGKSARPFLSVEAIREAKAKLVSAKDFKEWKDANEKIQTAMQESLWDSYRVEQSDYSGGHVTRRWVKPEGFGAVWDANNAMYEAMAKYLKGGPRTGFVDPSKIRGFLRAAGFHNPTTEAVNLFRDVAYEIRDAPTEYFEAKPERGVRLEEFAGAAIPEDTAPEVREMLKRRGIPFETYAGKDSPEGNANRQAAVDKILAGAKEGGREVKFAAQPFYSHLERTAAKIPQAMSGADLDRYLRDPKRGVKADEMKWTGLDDFLKERAGKKVTSQEVQDFLAQNRVEVKEVTLGAPDKANEAGLEKRKAIFEKWLPQIQALGKKEANVQTSSERRVAREERDHIENLRDEEADAAYKIPEYEPSKFGQYQTPGGENYRELLLTIPGRRMEQRDIEEHADANARRNGKDPDTLSATEYAHYLNEADRFLRGKRVASTFSGGHFPESGVLAHVRFNERTDAEGKKVLFIEEIQSDWAQKGRRQGFKGGAEQRFEDLKAVVEKRYGKSLVDLRVGGPGHRRGPQPPEITKDLAAIDEAYKAAQAEKHGSAVPPGPFVGKTEAWSELAMKRMVRWAAENGFDKVAWTTGEQQAARYDLSKQIDSLQWDLEKTRSTGDKVVRVVANKGNRELFNKPLSLDTTLDETIGKEHADRIRASVEAGEKGGEFSGLDLKVGGEGMKGFYDQILPAVASKIGKKFGAKVGETEIDTFTGNRYAVDGAGLDADGNQMWGVFPIVRGADGNLDYGPVEKRFETHTEAIRARTKLEAAAKARPDTTVHALDITPEMRRSVVEEGQPLFRAQPGQSEPATGITADHIKRAFAAADVKEVKPGEWLVDLPGDRQVRVRVSPEGIELNAQAFEKGYGRKFKGEAEEIVGKWQRIDRGGLISLAKAAGQGTVHHEAFHAAMDLALSDKEKAAVLEKYGDEEAAAEAYAKWTPATPNSWFSKILAYARRLWTTFRPTWESAFEKTRTGEAYGKPSEKPALAEPKYATAPAAIGGAPASGPTPAALNNNPEWRLADRIATYFQDRFRPLEAVETSVRKQGGVVGAKGEDIKAAADALGSKVASKMDDYRREYVEPLSKALGKKIPLKDLDDYMAILHAPDRDAVIAKRSDGAITNGSGWTPAERTARWTDLERAHGLAQGGKIPGLEPAAAIVRRMRDKQLEVLQDGGLISKAQAQGWEKEMGPDYVPLRTAEVDQGLGTGQGFDIRGRESKAATGRGTKADSPVAFMLQQLLRATVRAEKNKVDQKFADFVKANNLFPMDEEHEKTELAANGKIHKVRDALRDMQDFTYKVDGETHRIDIAEDNPLLDRALRNMSATEMNPVVAHLANWTRRFSTLVTSWNPAFMFTNFARDIQEATANMGAEHGAKVARDVISGVPAAMKDIFQHARDPSKASQMARDFYADGGAIGWYSVDKIPDLEKQLTTHGPGTWEAVKRGGNAIKNVVETMNKAVENGTRFSTYVALRKAGASREKAANASRNATLDFTKKGEAGPTINALYAFFNANVQGAKRMKEVIIDYPRGRAIGAGVVAMGMAMDAYNRANSGDDNKDGIADYDEIPDYVKQRNFIVMRGAGKKPLMFPMPYGFNILHTAGRQIMASFAGATKPGEAATGIVGAAYNAFNPLGGEADLVQTLSPTVLDPFVQHAENRTWTGRPLVPEKSFPGANKPPSEMYYKNVSPAAKAVAKWLNEKTGGDQVTPGYISWSPEVIAHYADAANGYITGGLGRTAVQAGEVATALSKGEAPELRQTPVLNRFVYEESPGLTGKRYRDNLQVLDDVEMRYKTYRKQGAVDKIQEIPLPLLRVKRQVDSIDKRIGVIRKAVKAGHQIPNADQTIEDLQNQANRLVAGARKAAEA